MVSFDINSGYQHFRLARQMSNMFILRYNDCLHGCVALSLGWGRYPMWFTCFMRPLFEALRSVHHMRLLSYLDDFLVCPRPPGTVAKKEDCKVRRKKSARS